MDNEPGLAELITIGRFARLSGVSVHALRHYDDVRLLVPAEIDDASGYRRYRRDQIRAARTIRALREVDMPIELIREVLEADDERARDVLLRHRARLDRDRIHLTRRIDELNAFLERGITVPPVQSGSRPVLITLAVDDRDSAIAFYREALGLPFDIVRRTRDNDYSSFVFGTYGHDDFFIMLVHDDAERCDQPGPSSVGFLVDDLETLHHKAIAAGATELRAPHDAPGRPRSSDLRDPSGNWITLTQDERGRPGTWPVQLRLAVDDLEATIAFYTTAFGLRYDVAQRRPDGDRSAFVFGEYARDDFFLLWPIADQTRTDRPGRASFSLLVDDLDVVHARALRAGATEAHPPYDAEGKPRGSAIIDPSGNWVGLAQG